MKYMALPFPRRKDSGTAPAASYCGYSWIRWQVGICTAVHRAGGAGTMLPDFDATHKTIDLYL